MQPLPQGQFRWTTNYQCHLTQGVFLRPLTSKGAAKIAYQVLDISFLFGAPAIFHSKNGRKCTDSHHRAGGIVIICHYGSLKAQTSSKWMSDNNIRDRTVGLTFTQQKNCSHRAEINQTRCKAPSGEDLMIQRSTSSLPAEILDSIQSEYDLQALSHPQTPNRASTTTSNTSQPLPTPTTNQLLRTTTMTSQQPIHTTSPPLPSS